MWVVYNKEDSPYVGWEVSSEQEAIEECEDSENLTYCYLDCGGYGYGYYWCDDYYA